MNERHYLPASSAKLRPIFPTTPPKQPFDASSETSNQHQHIKMAPQKSRKEFSITMITRSPARRLFSDRWNHNQKLRPFIPSSLNKKQTQLRLTARKRTEFGETKINNNCTVESAIDARGTIYHHHHNNCKKTTNARPAD